MYDVFAVAPLGAGIVDTTAGSALVTTFFTGLELKHMLEFLLMDSPTQRAQDHDKDEPWYGETTEQTYRPLPLEARSPIPFVLLAASFHFSSGEVYPGYFKPVTEAWDEPLPPTHQSQHPEDRPYESFHRPARMIAGVLAAIAALVCAKGAKSAIVLK